MMRKTETKQQAATAKKNMLQSAANYADVKTWKCEIQRFNQSMTAEINI